MPCKPDSSTPAPAPSRRPAVAFLATFGFEVALIALAILLGLTAILFPACQVKDVVHAFRR